MCFKNVVFPDYSSLHFFTVLQQSKNFLVLVLYCSDLFLLDYLSQVPAKPIT